MVRTFFFLAWEIPLLMFTLCTLLFYILLLFTLGHEQVVPLVYILLSSC